MSREIKRCLLAALCIALAVFACLFTRGRELKMALNMPPEATGGTITVSDESTIAISSQELRDGLLNAVFTPVSDGSVTAHVNWEPVDKEDMSIYNVDLELSTTFYGGVYEKVSGNFSCWHSVVWGTAAFLLICAFIFFLGCADLRGRAKFSYAPVVCLGLGAFTAVLGITALGFGFECVKDQGMTMWLLYTQIYTSCQSFVITTAPVVAVFCVALIVSNTVLLIREGFAPSNLYAMAAAVFILLSSGLGLWMFYAPVNFTMRNTVCNVYAALYCYFECMMFAVMLCTLYAAHSVPDLHTDYLLILGCRIRPDGTLYPLIRGRVDTALKFAEMQRQAGLPECIFVPSGGKGSDECMAEAEGMARYLRQHGVSDERILIEKQSVSTWENMCLSRALIERQHRGDVKCAFVTSSFHVFRSGMLASLSGWSIDGMGSKTVWYFWPNAFTREFLGLIASRIWVHLAAAAVITAFFTIMSLVF